MIYLNIGLERNDVGHIAPATVLRELASHGLTVTGHRIENSTTELTVVAQATAAEWVNVATFDHLARVLSQDCIAVSPDNGKTGQLIGPKSADWGTFNSAHFIPF